MNHQPHIERSDAQSLIRRPAPSGSSAVDLIKVVRRRLALILGAIAVITVAGTLVTFYLTPQYRAEAVLILDSRNQQVANVQGVTSGTPNDNSALRSEIDVLTSRSLAGKVIDSLNLMSNLEFNSALKPRMKVIGGAWISSIFPPSAGNAGKTPEQIAQDARTGAIDTYLKKLRVTTDGRSLTIKLDVDSQDPALAAKIVNKHAELYLLEQQQARFDATKRANAWLTDRAAELKGEVSKAEDAVEQYRQKYNIISTDQGGDVLRQQLQGINTQLIQAQADRDQAEARLKQVRGLVNSNATVDSIPEVLASPTIQALRTQEAQLVQNEAQLAAKYRDTHPVLIDARAQLRDVRAKIRTEINKIVVSMEQTVDSANNKVRALQTAVTGLTQKVSEQNINEVQLRELEREADASRTVFENFLSDAKRTSTGPFIDNSDARMVSRADAPLAPIFPKKSIFLAASGLFGLLIAFAVTALVEMLDNGFRSGDEIEDRSGVSGLGMVPKLSGRALRNVRPSDFVVQKPLSSFSEALRSIRNALSHAADKPPKLILITSAVPEEGKTLLSISLARSTAISGHKTLLLDADFRRPEVGKILGSEDGKASAADLIDGNGIFEKVIRRDEATGLHYFAAPADVANPLDFLDSRQFATLLAMLRDHYEYVFIDSPPVLAADDSLVLARLVDAVIFAVRWEKTPQQVVLSALKSLRTVGAPIAGTVLSRVNVKRHMRYGYADRAYYYGRYGAYYSK